eukprot:732606_1
MTCEDVLSMIMLYERTFSTLNAKIIEGADLYVATHDVFCKFVDTKGFDPDIANKNEWTNKTKVASDLFQSVLDEQQSFITLGQIRQTINKLMNDISAMKCGELTRIMNHLHKQFKNDNLRCQNDRPKYVTFLKSLNADGNVEDEISTQLTMRDDDDDDATNDNNNRRKSKSKRMKNPGLAFKHISKNKWVHFIDNIANNFQMNVLSTKISHIINNDKKEEDEEEKKKYLKKTNI